MFLDFFFLLRFLEIPTILLEDFYNDRKNMIV